MGRCNSQRPCVVVFLLMDPTLANLPPTDPPSCCAVPQVSDLKRQQSDKLERLREAEAAVQGLQAQIQGAAQAAQAARSQLEQRSAQDRCAPRCCGRGCCH